MDQEFEIRDPAAAWMWMMAQAWEKGISPREFRKCQARDIKNCIEINQAVKAREDRHAKLEATKNKMKRR